MRFQHKPSKTITSIENFDPAGIMARKHPIMATAKQDLNAAVRGYQQELKESALQTTLPEEIYKQSKKLYSLARRINELVIDLEKEKI